MITCTRRLQFAAGHRVKNHESKCAHLHGHNYVVEVTAMGDLDSIGRVLDFSVLKQLVGGWIETNWDHGFILWSQDSEAIAAICEMERQMQKAKPGWAQKCHLMPSNPTAENMAAYLLNVVGPKVLAGTGVRLVEVLVRETENCSAIARLD